MNRVFRNSSLALGGLSALSALPAHAAVDTAAITAAIADAGTAGAVVGAAVVVMIVGIKVFKWIRRAL